MLSGLLVVLALMLLNGVFAGAEIAVLSVRKTRLAELVESKARGASAVQWLRHEPERFLATVQVGITVVGTSAAAIGGERMAGAFERWLSGRAPWLGPHASGIGLLLVVVLITFLEIVVGELVPKSLALRSAERYALLVGPVLRAMASVTRPIVWLLTTVSNAVLGLFGDHTSFTEARLSPEEIQELVEEAARVGSLDAKTGEIASRALEFRELTAADVMVPRGAIVAVSRDADAQEIKRVLSVRRFARLPVFEGAPDNFIGYIAVKDALVPALDGAFTVDALLRPIGFVPSTARATDLLRQMQSQRQPMAIVVDENGGVDGLVTIEDLVEEVVGDILSEHEPAPVVLKRAPDGSILLPGSMAIRDVNRALGIELPEPENYTSIAGLCIHLAGRIPEPGATLSLPDGSTLEVVEASPRRVRSVRWRPASAQPSP